jgi:hypothetical protein
MGDQSQVDWILARIEKQKVENNFVYEVVPDLIYTRQPRLFKFLEGIINSDAQTCESQNPDSDKKTLCAYRVMEQIAPVVKNFPVQTDVSGDLSVSDYPAALRQVRSWLASNPSYSLVTDKY